MEYVDIRYYVVFGKCDASEHIDWELALTDEEAEIYSHALAHYSESKALDITSRTFHSLVLHYSILSLISVSYFCN